MAAVIRIVIENSGSGALDELGERARRQGGGFSGLKEIAVGALREIGAAAINLAGAGLAKLGDFMGDSVKAAGDFEAGLYSLQSVAGTALADAGLNFDDLKAKALQMGAETQFSAAQALDAMTALVKGGIPIKDVMDGATDATLALAAAGGLDLPAAADIMAKQLGVWAEKGVTAAEASNLLAQAANASVVDVDELALGLANAGGTAKTAGMEYKDLVQSMALIAPNFASAADAGTSFKTFISRLIPTTAPATKAMIELGLATEDGKSKFFDAQGAFIGMEGAASMLQQATAHLSEEERLLAFNTIFGSDAIRAADAIARAGGEGFNAMGATMAQAGDAASQAAIKNQGFNFALETMKGSLETLQIVIGSALLPVLASLINDYVTPGINAVMSFAQTVMGSSDPVATLTGTINTLIPGFSNVVAWVQQTIGVIQQVIASFQGGGVASTTLGAYIDVLSGIWQNLQTIVGTVTSVIQGVVTVVFGAIQGFLAEHGSEILATLRTAWGTIQQIVSTITQIIQATIGAWGRTINSDVTGNTSALKTIISGAWTVISSLIQAALTIIQGILTVALGAIRGDWGTAWDGIKTIAQGVWDAIKGLIVGVLEMIAGAMGTSLSEIGETWSFNLNAMADAVRPFVDAATRGFNAIVGAAQGAIDWIQSVADTLGSIDIPDWLEGHSPPPMAEWLSSIGGAAEYAGAALTTVQPGVVSNRSMTYNQQRQISITQNYRGAAPPPAYNSALVRSLGAL